MDVGRIELHEATAAHVRALLPRLRDDDRNEIHAAGFTCKQALWRSWKGSHLRTAALVDGEIAAIWGCGGPLLGDVGRPWLLTAPACERVPLAFVKIGRLEARRMLAVHERLIGLVLGSHWRAIRTLTLMGFQLGHSVYLPGGAEFLEFFKRRN
jgi:hypothetical protein